MIQSPQPQLFATGARSAAFCPDRIYRYTLWRRWSQGKRYVNFILLNPSTADETADDNTVRKCIKFARSWGYNALCITNLFAYRSTDRRAMKQFPDPIGYGNDRWLLTIAREASLIVAAWSQDGVHLGRAAAVKRMLQRFDLHYLRISPRRPALAPALPSG